MFSIGQHVIHPGQGVCTVVGFRDDTPQPMLLLETKQGHAQSYSVTADGIDSGTATNRNSLDFRMSPWAKCNTASVQQVFNGATSDC